MNLSKFKSSVLYPISIIIIVTIILIFYEFSIRGNKEEQGQKYELYSTIKRGNEHFNNDKYRWALTDFEMAYEMDSTNFVVNYMLGVLYSEYERITDIDKAIFHFNNIDTSKIPGNMDKYVFYLRKGNASYFKYRDYLYQDTVGLIQCLDIAMSNYNIAYNMPNKDYLVYNCKGRAFIEYPFKDSIIKGISYIDTAIHIELNILKNDSQSCIPYFYNKGMGYERLANSLIKPDYSNFDKVHDSVIYYDNKAYDMYLINKNKHIMSDHRRGILNIRLKREKDKY